MKAIGDTESVLRRSSKSECSIGDKHGKCEHVKVSSVL
jgi:hypothetical protein